MSHDLEERREALESWLLWCFPKAKPTLNIIEGEKLFTEFSTFHNRHWHHIKITFGLWHHTEGHPAQTIIEKLEVEVEDMDPEEAKIMRAIVYRVLEKGGVIDPHKNWRFK